MKLDDRKKAILEAIIKDYVKTAEPVGSRAIVRKYNMHVSAATVRNEMADLEEMGFLEQPHTSSGRIPSESGFRYYVDYMMVKDELTQGEEDFLKGMLTEKIEDLSAVIQRTANVLSQITNYAAVVVGPPSNKVEFRHLQLVPVGSNQAMVIVVSDVGSVIHKRIDIPSSIRPEDLEDISRVLNASCQGTHLGDLSRTALGSLRRELIHRRQVIDRALEAIEMAMEEEQDEKVYVSGALNIVNQPEFKDFEKLRKILVALEEHDLIKSLLGESGLKEVRIKIGNENAAEEIKELSLVFTSYEVDGKDMGRIGLIGPVRMEYWKATPSVEKVRDIVQNVLSRMLR
ncbi:MAG: heat-inducible transcriptional repressor HrcA [Ignavibacteriales bacterium]